uniref:Chromo domain-containing protein n=1 Tax=Angiostrongylus cantonensis TaxID=6313 RepID=A0A0K0CTA8_ANGCA
MRADGVYIYHIKWLGYETSSDPENFVEEKHMLDDPYGGFKYISRESDGFKKGYKVVKVSLVTEHPTSGDVVGVVVFTHPHHGNQLAQYIPLREIHENAPMTFIIGAFSVLFGRQGQGSERACIIVIAEENHLNVIWKEYDLTVKVFLVLPGYFY